MGATYSDYIVYVDESGAREDAELELEFRRTRDGSNFFHGPLPFESMTADKRTNAEGLQLADLTARPIGLSVLRPHQKNRALAVVEEKFCRGESGRKDRGGAKSLPLESRRASG